jgi:hypothetical protein
MSKAIVYVPLFSGGDLSDDDYVQIKDRMRDVNGDGFLSENEMRAGFENGKRTCRIIKMIHKIMARGAIHQFLRIILNLRILVLLPVSTLPYVVNS